MTDLPRRRLHPLSPFLHSARQLVAVVAVVSWQGYSQLGLEKFAIGVVVVLLGAVAISVVAWRYTGYEITGRELRIHEGTFSRRTRAIPLERLQSVEVVRPLLAQLTGLAELRLEVVGGGKAEAPLAYLTVGEAQDLRKHLLELANARGDAAAEQPSAEQVLYETRDDELLLSQSLSPEVIYLPIGVALIGLQFVTNGSFGFVAVASTVTALIGAILRPVRRITRDWRCRLTIADDRLHIRRGLTETRSQVVPVQRVQAVTITWPLLWRMKRWVRVNLDIAAHGAEGAKDEEKHMGTTLLPVAVTEQARAVVPWCLPRPAPDRLAAVDIAALPLTGVPDRAKWVVPLARTVLAAGATEHVFATVDGVLTRRLRLVPYARIQSVRVEQGWLQQRLGLATVHVDLAGAPSASAPERDVHEAYALAWELTERARAARALTAPERP
ncbi:PH domain-containing protein [Hamadaea tsunoensis]|uniref:PH domain-containing protein n=1 Tax=Hamadaea tsunoensis TaxID=53368 RepID=UPI00041088EE|nr:PH domain-containing protein [Hamadaea tsunoensis]